MKKLTRQRAFRGKIYRPRTRHLWRADNWGVRLGPFAVVAAIALATIFFGSKPHLNWREFSDEALQQAIKREQPVLIEFTAEWCLNCKVLDKTTYSNREVVQCAQAAGLALYRIDMTDFNEGHKQLLATYGGSALPFALLLDGRGKVARRFAGMFSAGTLVAAIAEVAGPKL